jgi:hypothetical protein
MKLLPTDKKKAAIGGSVVLVLAIVAAYLNWPSSGPSKPDAATQAAIERSKQIQANMDSKQPPPPADLPVEARPPRKAVKVTK